VAERRPRRGPSEIVVVDARTRETRVVVSSPGSRNVSPVWLPDGRILFASDRGGGPFALYAVDPRDGALQRLSGTAPNAQQPAVSPDGSTIAYVGYTPEGLDLFSAPLGGAAWVDADRDVVGHAPALPPVDAAPDPDSTPYRPGRTLAPTSWTPVVASDAGEFTGGAAVGASDALGRHTYGASAAWAASRARPDWQVGYAYDRWRPTLFADMSDDTDPWDDGDVRTVEVNAGLVLPFRRVRHASALMAALHASSDTSECDACEPAVDSAHRRRAVRVGWRFDSAKAFGYSISHEQGGLATVTTEFTRQALGASGDAGAITVDLRGYLPAGPRHATLALRAAAATSWGDPVVRRLFSASGSGPQAGGTR
jgi:hypothetical protein